MPFYLRTHLRGLLCFVDTPELQYSSNTVIFLTSLERKMSNCPLQTTTLGIDTSTCVDVRCYKEDATNSCPETCARRLPDALHSIPSSDQLSLRLLSEFLEEVFEYLGEFLKERILVSTVATVVITLRCRSLGRCGRLWRRCPTVPLLGFHRELKVYDA